MIKYLVFYKLIEELFYFLLKVRYVLVLDDEYLCFKNEKIKCIFE